MDWKRIALSAAIVASVAALPFSGAEARWYHRGPGFWPFWAGAAVVGTAAAVATAPFRYPYYYYGYAPRYYYPPAYYYGPAYPYYYYR